MISFSPTQYRKRLERHFTATPVVQSNEQTMPKNDYKLNYNNTYPFLNDFVFFEIILCLSSLSSTQLSEQLPRTIQIYITW